jgi:hypothetical protein
MYHFLYPTKDSTIYEYDQDKNVGSDEILELDRVRGEEARALIQFDLRRVNEYYGGSVSNSEALLRLWTTEASNLPFEYDLACYPVTEAWNRGVGREPNDLETSGVTWIQRTDADWIFPGADFDPSVEGRQRFRYESADAKIDVTELTDYWILDENDNYGLIVIRENDRTQSSELKFFGGLTHTIYSPELVIRYDDSVFAPSEEQEEMGALDPELDEVRVEVQDQNPEYVPDGIKRFHVLAREKYAKQPFAEEITRPTPRYLDGDLRYEIRDALNEKTLVPFSQASTLSFGPKGYYFDIDLRNVQPSRHYELRFRYKSPTGYTETFEGTEFIVRN